MKNLFIVLLIFVCNNFFAQSVKAEQVVADEVCTCLNKDKSNPGTQEEKKKLLTICFEQAVNNNKEIIQKDPSFPKEKTKEAGREFGREMGKKAREIMLKNCPKFKKIFGS